MAISFDTFGTNTNTGAGTTFSYSHTIGTQGNRFLYFSYLGGVNGSITSLKFAGAVMSPLGRIFNNDPNGAFVSESWYLANPPTGLGTFNGTFSAAMGEFDAVSSSYFGVDQLSPIVGTVSTSVTSINGTVTRTLNPNNWLIGGGAINGNSDTVTTGNGRGTAIGNGAQVVADNTGGTLVFHFANAGTPSIVIIAAEVAASQPGYKSLLGVGR